MRTTELKIDGKNEECILQAGGYGAKVYFVDKGRQAVVIGRKVHLVTKDNEDYPTVTKYVTVRYQPTSEKETIYANFKSLVDRLKSKHESRCKQLIERWAKVNEGDVSYEEESKLINDNKKKPENMARHKFQVAKWTFPNGHPRCLKCGSEETVGGFCDPKDS